MPSTNSARYTQRIIQTVSHKCPSFLKKSIVLTRPLHQSHSQCMATAASGPVFESMSLTVAAIYRILCVSPRIDTWRLVFKGIF